MPDLSQIVCLLQSKNKRLQWLAIAAALCVYSPTLVAIADDPDMSNAAKLAKAAQSTGALVLSMAYLLIDPKEKPEASTDKTEGT